MKELIIDTCGDILNVVLKTDDNITNAHSDCIKQHSVVLLEKIEGLLRDADCKIEDIDCFGVVVGSGSFTGIRVGIATVRAFCYVLRKRCKAVTSCEAVAYNEGICGKRIGIVDAKQNKLYLQRFDGEAAECDILCLTRDDLADYLRAFPSYQVYSSTPLDDVEHTLVLDNTNGLVRAVSIKEAVSSSHILPTYVLMPQAERDKQ